MSVASLYPKPKRPVAECVSAFFAMAAREGISMASIAVTSSVTEDTLSQWRNGKASPTLSKFEKILERTGCRLVLVPSEPPKKNRSAKAQNSVAA